MPDGPAVAPVPELDPALRRWLHDKYERFDAEEGQLAASRTSYFAAIGTVLITAVVVSVSDFESDPTRLQLIVTCLASLGILISLVWVVLLHRTIDAQHLWRDAAVHLESVAPPIEGELLGPVRLRSGAILPLNLLRPYTAHRARFSKDRRISWMDRISPDVLTEVLPLTFLAIWAAVLVGIWIYPIA